MGTPPKSPRLFPPINEISFLSELPAHRTQAQSVRLARPPPALCTRPTEPQTAFLANVALPYSFSGHLTAQKRRQHRRCGTASESHEPTGAFIGLHCGPDSPPTVPHEMPHEISSSGNVAVTNSNGSRERNLIAAGMPRRLRRIFEKASISRLLPISFQKQFFDSVGMEHVMQREVSKHDKYRIVVVLAVFGSSLPVFGGQSP